jgi:hypothetical protein
LRSHPFILPRPDDAFTGQISFGSSHTIHHNASVPTVAQLEEQKEALQARLDAGDLSAEAALERIDRAIAGRVQKVAYSQKRLAAVKTAVKAGVPLEKTKPRAVAAAVKKRNKAKRSLNDF